MAGEKDGGVEWRTLAHEHLECGICGLLHGTGQAFGCFAYIAIHGNMPSTQSRTSGAALFCSSLGRRLKRPFGGSIGRERWDCEFLLS